MKILNYTEHSVNVLDENNKLIESYPSRGNARVFQDRQLIETVNGIEVYRSKFSTIQDLPEPEEGIKYIVSLIVNRAGSEVGRTDLLTPDKIVKGEHGQIIGCRGFCIY